MPKSQTYISHLALALGATLCGSTAWAATLTVTVDNIQIPKGQVRIAVYNEANWLSKQDWIARALKSTANDTAVAMFELPPGRYAVAVLHDVNDNGKMDYRLLRLPKEPYGFSNDAKPKLGPPQFENAAFDLSDEGLAIVITLSD